ncbi:hypothetical protein Tco_1555082 [Tanacetum coccineum]
MKLSLCQSTIRICRSRASIACVPPQESSLWLKQAPRAWYDKLSAFSNQVSGFTKAWSDPTLLRSKEGKHLLLFLKSQRHLYNNPNMAQEILKKFVLTPAHPLTTPMAERPNLVEDKGGKLMIPTRFRANWVKPTSLPKKKQVTFQEPPRTSNRPIQKPPVKQNKKPNVSVYLSTRTKLATESRKPMPKSHTRNHHILPNKSVNARRAADHNRKLNVVDHNQFVIRSLKSVNTKTPQAKHSVNHTKKVWKATRNHNVNTTKTAWRPTRKVVGSVKPQWKPTGRHFALYDNCPLTRIMEPIVEPLELTPSVSSSSKVTMISRSKGRTVADSIAERLTRPTAYKFKTDCSIIPVWVF